MNALPRPIFFGGKLSPELLDAWSGELAAVAAKPLELRPDFPAVAARWEAWWRFEADRPLLIAFAPKTNNIRWGKAFDLLERPEEWLAVRRQQVAATHWAGDTVPFLRVDIGPVAVGSFLGAKLELSEETQTTWQHPTLESDWWRDLSFLDFDEHNRWFQAILKLARAAAREARGRYLVTLPDIAGGLDVLVNMRGPENLCMDLFEDRDAIGRAAEKVLAGWEQVFGRLYDAILAEGAGVSLWHNLWSSRPYDVPACDFCGIIGPADFADLALPTLRRQAALAGRSSFHLDGPQCARHVDALLAETGITAIQYTPGAGSPSALAKLDLLKRIQAARKPLLVFTPHQEVERLAGDLDPRGLAIWVDDVSTPAEADAAFRAVL